MIIKRSQKSEMPNMKRCRAREIACEEGEGRKRKRKKPNPSSYYPPDLLLDVAAGRIPLFSEGILRRRFFADFSEAASWSTEVSFCSGEVVESESKLRGGGEKDSVAADAFRPPLVKTSRGRIQVLPCRFHDSVLLDPLEKEEPKSIALDPVYDSEIIPKGCRKEKFGFKNPKFNSRNTKEQLKMEKFNCRNAKLYTLFKEGEDKLQCAHIWNSHSKESSPLMEIEEAEERLQKESSEKGKEFYSVEEFVVGDIVWARLGKTCPAWPAIVIDPISQAPGPVMNFDIARAVCVMFFGHLQNGKERVNVD